MFDTVLHKSGDIYFSESDKGCNSPLPSGKPKWLNDQVLLMAKAIADLENKVPLDGRDGREIRMGVKTWPEGDAPTTGNQAICWQIVARAGEPEEKWHYLIYLSELEGPQGPSGMEGPEGPAGHDGKDGTSVAFKGQVSHPSDLTHLSGVSVGDGYVVKSTHDLWVSVALPSNVIGNWSNMGPISGGKGDPGPRGPKGAKGDRGPKGDSGGVSAVVMNFLVSTITSTVISYVTADITSTINAAIDTLADQVVNIAEDAATAAVEKAIDDMMDEFKGEKGDKGDKGDKGKDGTSFNLVGQWDTVTEFQMRYPLIAENVGKAALIGPKDTQKDLWIVSQTRVTPTPAYAYQNVGPMQGPKGDDATWNVSIRDKDFIETKTIEVVTGLPGGVPAMFIQDTDSILVSGIEGTPADPQQVGFRMSMKYPIPTLVEDGALVGTPTKDKVLSNDGQKLKWVEQTGGSGAKDQILLKGADLRIWAITVDNEGRICQDLSIETTDDTVIKVKSPNGRNWGISIDNNGRMTVSEVI